MAELSWRRLILTRTSVSFLGKTAEGFHWTRIALGVPDIAEGGARSAERVRKECGKGVTRYSDRDGSSRKDHRCTKILGCKRLTIAKLGAAWDAENLSFPDSNLAP
jgi:hypothetical protein